MEDTDWRPSPCPKCGKMREAGPHPVCLICDDKKVEEFVSRRVMSYRDKQGKLFESMPDAIRSDLTVELDKSSADGLINSSHLARKLVQDAAFRKTVVDLLRELS